MLVHNRFWMVVNFTTGKVLSGPYVTRGNPKRREMLQIEAKRLWKEGDCKESIGIVECHKDMSHAHFILRWGGSESVGREEWYNFTKD